MPRQSIALAFCAVTVALPMVACTQDRAAPERLSLPDGFAIEVWTDEVPNARSMALGDDGTVYVATRRDGRVYAVVDTGTGDPEVRVLARDLKTPNGIDVFDGDLYVAETERLLRFPDIAAQQGEDPRFEVVSDRFPEERHHGWRYIRFGPDGKLYMSIGAPCNVCDREGFGTIVRMNSDASDLETWAYGVRNSVGLEFHPETGELWFTDNGRDMLGDDLPPGELNHAADGGRHYGFPFCHAGTIADPEFGDQRDCDEFEAPAMPLGPHVAPLGLAFYDGEQFPEEFSGDLFIAEHGSWNRTEPIGYRITRVRMNGQAATGYEVFAEGWLTDGDVSGRPVDVLVRDDGSLLVSDDHAGRIYRISYSAEPGTD